MSKQLILNGEKFNIIAFKPSNDITKSESTIVVQLSGCNNQYSNIMYNTDRCTPLKSTKWYRITIFPFGNNITLEEYDDDTHKYSDITPDHYKNRATINKNFAKCIIATFNDNILEGQFEAAFAPLDLKKES